MSTADRRLANARRRAESGYSLIEVIMVLSILALMSFVVERTLASTQNADRWLSAVRKSTERGQRIAYHLREIVSASRKLFGNDAVGQGYFNALDLTRDPIAPSSRLPMIDEIGSLSTLR